MKKVQLLILMTSIAIIFFTAVFHNSPLEHSSLLGKYQKTTFNDLPVHINHSILKSGKLPLAVGISLAVVADLTVLSVCPLLMLHSTPIPEETILKKSGKIEKILLNNLDNI